MRLLKARSHRLGTANVRNNNPDTTTAAKDGVAGGSDLPQGLSSVFIL